MNDNDWIEFAHFADKLADTARTSIKKYFRTRVDDEKKSDLSPVTIADRETELALRALIRECYPNHGIIGEEYEEVRSTSDLCWALDPIDGTKSFLSGKPTFGTLIALLCRDKPVLGIIDAPVLQERWLGIHNNGCTYNDSACHTNKNESLKNAWVHATTIDMFDDNERLCFDAVTNKARGRIFGAECYAYGLLACGHVDIVMEADMKPYDYLALVPVVENAGGCISDWTGAALTKHSGKRVLASASKALHEQVLTTINQATAS